MERPGCHCGDPLGLQDDLGLGDGGWPLWRGRKGACRSTRHSSEAPFLGDPSSPGAGGKASVASFPQGQGRPQSPCSPPGRWLAQCPHSCVWLQMLTADPSFVAARLSLSSAGHQVLPALPLPCFPSCQLWVHGLPGPLRPKISVSPLCCLACCLINYLVASLPPGECTPSGGRDFCFSHCSVPSTPKGTQ